MPDEHWVRDCSPDEETAEWNIYMQMSGPPSWGVQPQGASEVIWTVVWTVPESGQEDVVPNGVKVCSLELGLTPLVEVPFCATATPESQLFDI